MMIRAWYIVADILIIGVLLLSLIVWYLFPPKPKLFSLPVPTSQQAVEIFNMPTLSLDNTTLPSTLPMTAQEYTIENIFLEQPLSQRLEALGVELGVHLFIRIFKVEALLEIWVEKEGSYYHLKDYAICAFSGGLGPKQKEGDRQAVEGFYRVKKEQLNPHSKFHLSFNLGYPNAYDRAHHRTGSYLMVHGSCRSVGCYAMTDEKIEEIYALVESALNAGQQAIEVHAFPFHLTAENMAYYSENRWFDFWMNLKEGYDYFEIHHTPPIIKIIDNCYHIYE